MSDGTGSAPAPAPQPAPAPAPAAPAPAAPAAWHSTFDDETRGWIENRGLHQKQQSEALTALVATARGAEKKFGVPEDRLIKLPASLDEDGALDPIYDRLGRPKTPDEYKLTAPDANDAIGAEFAKALANAAHKNGLSTRQAQEVFKSIDEYVTGIYEREETAAATRREADMAKLQAEWGETFGMNKLLAQEAAKAVGATAEEIDALTQALGSDAAVVKLFARIGQKRGGEASFIAGDNPVLKYGATTPEAARSKIEEIKQDPVRGEQLRKAMRENLTESPIMKEYRALTTLAARSMAAAS